MKSLTTDYTYFFGLFSGGLGDGSPPNTITISRLRREMGKNLKGLRPFNPTGIPSVSVTVCQTKRCEGFFESYASPLSILKK